MTTTPIKRGDVWEIRFDPTEGDEIQKIRPAVVMNVATLGIMRLSIIIPITNWREKFE